MTFFVGSIDRKAIPLARQAEFGALVEPTTSTLYADAASRSDDLVVLATCERVEVYASTTGPGEAPFPNGSPFADFPWTTSTGAEAVRHLFRVAAGLESRLVGEPHILGQVRDALNDARSRRTTRRRTRDAFSAAIRTGRRVRNQTGLGTVAGDYASRAIAFLDQELGALDTRQVAVVGSGVLATDVALALEAAGVAGLTIVGRHERRVRELATLVDGQVLVLDNIEHTLRADRDFDAVITATSSSQPLVRPATYSAWRSTLFVDLGATPNVDPQVDSLPGTRVVRLMDLGGTEDLSRAVDAANAIVNASVDRFLARAEWKPGPQASVGSGWRQRNSERFHDARP
jgi:glutamyl-tRNA reductase